MELQDKHPPMVVLFFFRLLPVGVVHCYALIRHNLIYNLASHAPLSYPILLQLRIGGEYCKFPVARSLLLAMVAFASAECSFRNSIHLDSPVNFPSHPPPLNHKARSNHLFHVSAIPPCPRLLPYEYLPCRLFQRAACKLNPFSISNSPLNSASAINAAYVHIHILNFIHHILVYFTFYSSSLTIILPHIPLPLLTSANLPKSFIPSRELS